jgi:translation initiation factor 1A
MAYRNTKKNTEVVHVLMVPRDDEVIGLVTKSLGATNFMVFCSDKNERTCSIPGRLKRRFWIKEGDVVLVKPWVVQGDKRGDIVWRYSMMDRDMLKQRGYEIPR